MVLVCIAAISGVVTQLNLESLTVHEDTCSLAWKVNSSGRSKPASPYADVKIEPAKLKQTLVYIRVVCKCFVLFYFLLSFENDHDHVVLRISQGLLKLKYQVFHTQKSKSFLVRCQKKKTLIYKLVTMATNQISLWGQ